MTKLRFITVPGAVSDAGELLAGLAHAARELGAVVEETEEWGDALDGVAIFAPGDTFGIPGAKRPAARQLRRLVAVCEDAPTGPLDSAYLNARRCAAAATPDRQGAEMLSDIASVRIALGSSEAWRPQPAQDRDIDVLCMARRGVFADRYLASFGRTLWRRRSWLLGAPEVPTGAEGKTRPPLPLGEERKRLLARSSILLLGLGEEGREVERLRALQAALAGTVIVAPHGLDLAPLVPGRDHAVAEARNLAAVADSLLEEPAEIERLRHGAAKAADEAPDLRAAGEKLLALAERVGGGRVQPGAAATRARAKSALSRGRDALRSALNPPPNPSRVAAKRKALEEIAQRRRQAEAAAGGEDPGRAEVVHATPAYEAAEPRISVCIPVYEHAGPLRRALASACGSGRDDVELLVLDDGSGPETVAAVREMIEEIPWMPAVLLGRRANRGLGPGRTDMAGRARGELLFMLDADNDVYPTAFDRLTAALGEDAGAAFAYSLIEAHTEERPRGLLSASPWDPRRLRRGNYIDAMSMIRRSALLEAGGYTDDIRLHGWEDFDLWCRFAARGMRGLLVPEVLCRYSLSESSMISVTNLDSSEAWELLRDLYPEVLGGAPLPTYPPPPPDIEL